MVVYMIFNLNTVNLDERNRCECSLFAVLINDSLRKLVQYVHNDLCESPINIDLAQSNSRDSNLHSSQN